MNPDIPLLTFLAGLSRYLPLCALSVLAGMSLVRLTGLPLFGRPALALAPVLTMTFWIIALGLCIPLGITVGSLAPWLWALTLALASWTLIVPLLSRVRKPSSTSMRGTPGQSVGRASRVTLRDGWPILVCAVLPLIVLFKNFSHGLSDYLGSDMPDGWLYAAYGEYLDRYPWHLPGPLAPLYQYTAASFHRFSTSGLLAFLAPVVSPQDTQAAMGLFLAWTLFVFGSACAFCAVARGIGRGTLLTYLVLCVVSGWIYNLVWTNNLDNALQISYLPTFAGVAALLQLRSSPWAVLLGALGAGVVLSHPHLAPITLGGTALLLGHRWWQTRRESRYWGVTLATALAVLLLLLLPSARRLFPPVLEWLGMVSSRPEETALLTGLFPGLQGVTYHPSAFWGLGGEWQVSSSLRIRNVVAWGFSALAAIGLVRMHRLRDNGPVGVVVVFSGGALACLLWDRWTYGAYKMILLGWWALCLALVSGIAVLAARLRRHTESAQLLIGACVAMIAFPLNHLAESKEQIGARSRYETETMRAFRPLEQLPTVVGDAKLFVLVDDWLAHLWAVYLLRDRPATVAAYRSYLETQLEGARGLRRSVTEPFAETRYVLTDDGFADLQGRGQGWKLIWSGGAYRLWDPGTTEWAFLANPAKPGRQDFTVDVAASRAGVVQLPAARLSSQGVHGESSEPAGSTESAGVLLAPVRPGLNTISVESASPSTDGTGLLPVLTRERLVPLRLFERMPSFGEISVPLDPQALHVKWRNGVAEGFGGDPQLIFGLKEPRFVYAVRLRISYDDTTVDPPLLQIFWAQSGRTGFSESESATVALPDRRRAKRLTIPVNASLDMLRVDPDIRPCVFRISELALYVEADE